MIEFFLPIAEALIVGYLALVITYMVCMFLITRLGPKALMSDDSVTKTYTALLCLTWFAASLAGADASGRLAPLPPYGTIGFPILIALISAFVVVRNVRQLSGQQSLPATAGVFVMIAAGTVSGLYLNHAF